MKALLMHLNRDFDPEQGLPRHAPAVTQDLALETVQHAMAGGDRFLHDVAHAALLSSLGSDRETILYRQEIVRDCLRHPEAIAQFYELAAGAIDGKDKLRFSIFSRYPPGILYDAMAVMRMLMDSLVKVRHFADAHAGLFESQGLSALMAMLRRELSDDYLAVIREHLKRLEFKDGLLLSAQLGVGHASCGHVLRQPRGKPPHWLARLLGRGQPGYSFRIGERDEAGARILSDLRSRGISLVANAVAQSAEHIAGFFATLRTELAFYIGCLNLHRRLDALGVHSSFPVPADAPERGLHCAGLSDVSLALTMERAVVANTVNADGKGLVVVTGANQGGKSSFLRSLGLAYVMMHAGMFVAASDFGAAPCAGLFTHYKREEDASLAHGKFDEELARLSEIADAITPGSILLCNESFASTNEREGSEIARQVVDALLERRIRVFFVTHQYDFARSRFEQDGDETLFLRAERLADGQRSFRVVPGEPLETSYGEDLYARIFGAEA